MAADGRNIDSGWLRLSPIGLVILFVRGGGRFLRENVPLLLGAGAGAAFVEQIGPRELALAAAAGILLAMLVTLVYHRRFRFRLEGDVLVVQKGVVERKELRISAGRVQQIIVEQPLYMRPFGVVRFSLDTPGGVVAEVDLPGISRHLAEDLRVSLNAARGGPGAGRDGDGTGDMPAGGEGDVVPLYAIGPVALTLHGLASNHAYVAAVVAAPFLQPLERLLLRNGHGLAEQRWLETARDWPWLMIPASMLVLVVLLVLLSVVFAWLRYYGYRLQRERRRFIQRSGLLTWREQALASSKLQAVEWVEPVVGRLLGRGYLVCRQYGGHAPGGDDSGHRFVVPGLDRSGGDRLSQCFWPDLTSASAHESGSEQDNAVLLADRRVSRLYRRAMLVRLEVAAGLAMLLVLVAGGPAWLLVVGGVALFLAPPIAHLRWRALGWKRSGRYLLVCRGLLGRRTSLFPLENVQAVTLRESWFQRRHGLSTLHLQLASGPVSLPWIERATALEIADEALFRVESNAVPRNVPGNCS